ncbi:ABC transporter permease [Chloroflexota bacterium]
MLRLLVPRLVQSIFLIWAVVSVVFLTTFVIGDPARIMLPPETPEEVYLQFRHQMGFDRPILVQYADYVGHAATGDFGDSWWQRTPALPIAVRPLRATLQLAVIAILLAIVLGISIGLYASFHPGSWIDRLATMASLLGVSLPLIWLCPMMIILFAGELGWLPTSGYGTWQHMVMPVIALTILPMGRIVQITRASMMDELVKQYVTTAHAKGLPQRIVLVRHALKNAILPVITVTGWEFILLVSGYTIIVETVFGYPGMGFMLYSAIRLRDMPLIAATAFVIAVVVVAINFFVDILYGIANPLIRAQ